MLDKTSDYATNYLIKCKQNNLVPSVTGITRRSNSESKISGYVGKYRMKTL